jgi:hypothetical protein
MSITDYTRSASAETTNHASRTPRAWPVAALTDVSEPTYVCDHPRTTLATGLCFHQTVLVDWGYAQQWERTQAIATVDSATALEKILLRR